MLPEPWCSQRRIIPSQAVASVESGTNGSDKIHMRRIRMWVTTTPWCSSESILLSVSSVSSTTHDVNDVREQIILRRKSLDALSYERLLKTQCASTRKPP